MSVAHKVFVTALAITLAAGWLGVQAAEETKDDTFAQVKPGDCVIKLKDVRGIKNVPDVQVSVVKAKGGDEVASGMSDKDGEFKVFLLKGKYNIVINDDRCKIEADDDAKDSKYTICMDGTNALCNCGAAIVAAGAAGATAAGGAVAAGTTAGGAAVAGGTAAGLSTTAIVIGGGVVVVGAAAGGAAIYEHNRTKSDDPTATPTPRVTVVPPPPPEPTPTPRPTLRPTPRPPSR